MHVTLMQNKVLETLRLYLVSFLSYRENTGGVIFAPPSAAWVKKQLNLLPLTVMEILCMIYVRTCPDLTFGIVY